MRKEHQHQRQSQYPYSIELNLKGKPPQVPHSNSHEIDGNRGFNMAIEAKNTEGTVTIRPTTNDTALQEVFSYYDQSLVHSIFNKVYYRLLSKQLYTINKNLNLYEEEFVLSKAGRNPILPLFKKKEKEKENNIYLQCEYTELPNISSQDNKKSYPGKKINSG